MDSPKPITSGERQASRSTCGCGSKGDNSGQARRGDDAEISIGLRPILWAIRWVVNLDVDATTGADGEDKAG